MLAMLVGVVRGLSGAGHGPTARRLGSGKFFGWISSLVILFFFLRLAVLRPAAAATARPGGRMQPVDAGA